MERNIKYIFGPHKKPPQPLSSLHLAYTKLLHQRDHIWTHTWRILSVCANTESSNLVTQGQKNWDKYLKSQQDVGKHTEWRQNKVEDQNTWFFWGYKDIWHRELSTKHHWTWRWVFRSTTSKDLPHISSLAFNSLWSLKAEFLSRPRPWCWEGISYLERFKLLVNNHLISAPLLACPFAMYIQAQWKCKTLTLKFKCCFLNMKRDT